MYACLSVGTGRLLPPSFGLPGIPPIPYPKWLSITHKLMKKIVNHIILKINAKARIALTSERSNIGRLNVPVSSHDLGEVEPT